MADVEEYREFIDKQANRYIAQILADFEKKIVPHVARSGAGEIQDFKGVVRGKLNDFAGDANEAWRLVEAGMTRNLLAQELRDSIGAPA